MKLRILTLVTLLVMLLGLVACSGKADVDSGETWQKATSPEELGWSSEKLAVAQAYSENIGSAAVMIVDDGIVVDSWGDITRNYQCHSMRKSLLSALYGIYVDDGKIDISKTLKELGIDDRTPLTEVEKQATVADLLKAMSGVYIPAAGESSGMKTLRPERGSHLPGTFWYYNNWDFNALGTIFDQETGEKSIFQAFKTRIADPIGMQDFAIENLHYNYEPYSKHPYYGFRMSTRDLARFGLLFLREGWWQGQQIISSNWVQESTASHSETSPDSGYGYMWWTGVKGGLFPGVEVKEHSFYASGYRGHKIIVLPYRNLVIVHRVDTDAGLLSISDEQIGILLWLVLDAAGETGIGEAPIEAAKGIRLNEENVQEILFSGDTIRVVYELGDETYVESHFPDGTMTLVVGGELTDTGKWWFVSDKYYQRWEHISADNAPIYIVLDGTILKLFDLDGMLVQKLNFARE
jgi:CubicO group peptidase (beta-lactamase class C family)